MAWLHDKGVTTKNYLNTIHISDETLELLYNMYSKLYAPKPLKCNISINTESRAYYSLATESLCYKFLNRLEKYGVTGHILHFYGSKTTDYNILNSGLKAISLNLSDYFKKRDKGLYMIQNTEYADVKIYNLKELIQMLSYFDIGREMQDLVGMRKTAGPDEKVKIDEKLEIYGAQVKAYKENLATNNEIVIKILRNLIFQVIYTLECFERLNFSHNDLHLGNILVYVEYHISKFKDDDNILGIFADNEKYYKGKYITYVIDGKEYKLPHYGFTVKIYDFDFSCKHKKNDSDNVEILSGKINNFAVAVSSKKENIFFHWLWPIVKAATININL